MPIVKNLYVIVAREVSTDATDKMNSIIKVIDKFTFGVDMKQLAQEREKLKGQQVALPASYWVATSWMFDEKLKQETFLNFKISVRDPSGKDLGGPEQENLLSAGLNRVNMNFNMQGMPITSAGIYKLRAEITSKDGKTLAKGNYPFEVELLNGSQPPQNPLS